MLAVPARRVARLVGRSFRILFQNNFDKICGMIGKGSASLMDACIVSCAVAFCPVEKVDEIETFFKSPPVHGEYIRTDAKFLEMLEASPLSKNEFWQGL